MAQLPGIEIKINALDPLIAEFRRLPISTQKAARRAVSRTVTTGIARVSKQLREDAPLKAGRIKRNIRSKKPAAGGINLEGKIIISGRRIPLIEYQGRKTAKGATFKTSKSGGRRLLQSGVIKSLKFGPQILRRATDSGRPSGLVGRYPFHIAYGPSLATLIDQQGREIELDLNDLLRRRFLAELEFFRGARK